MEFGAPDLPMLAISVWCIVFAFLAGWERRGSNQRWLQDEDEPAQPDQLSPEELVARDRKMRKAFVLVGLVLPLIGLVGLVVAVYGRSEGWWR